MELLLALVLFAAMIGVWMFAPAGEPIAGDTAPIREEEGLVVA